MNIPVKLAAKGSLQRMSLKPSKNKKVLPEPGQLCYLFGEIPNDPKLHGFKSQSTKLFSLQRFSLKLTRLLQNTSVLYTQTHGKTHKQSGKFKQPKF